MDLVFEEGTRAIKLIARVGALVTRQAAIRDARRMCVERGRPVRVRDLDAPEGSGVLYTARPEVEPRRKACDCPVSCWGPAREQHAIACRPARPRCRWRRRAIGLCHCDRYHYPHRDGSGHCGNEAAYVAAMMTPRRRVA